jgi:hypothetical protein
MKFAELHGQSDSALSGCLPIPEHLGQPIIQEVEIDANVFRPARIGVQFSERLPSLGGGGISEECQFRRHSVCVGLSH